MGHVAGEFVLQPQLFFLESVEKVFKSAGIMDRFERFKKGEAVETLVQEAQEAETKRGATGKTGK